MPLAVVPVPALVSDNKFCVPDVVLFVSVPEYRFAVVPIDELLMVYVALNG